MSELKNVRPGLKGRSRKTRIETQRYRGGTLNMHQGLKGRSRKTRIETSVGLVDGALEIEVWFER